jgi:hypothetical protein
MKRILVVGVYATVLMLGIPSHLLAAEIAETENLVDCPIDEKNTIAIDYASGVDKRVFSKKGDTYYFTVPKSIDRVEAAETARSTKVASDLAVLREIAKTIAQAGGSGLTTFRAKIELPKCYQFTQGYERSTLSIKPVKSGDPNAKFGKANIITGSIENFWLSADMGTNNIKQLTLDANNKVVSKEKPASFYVGFNYKLGDVYQSYDVIGPETYKNISLKFLLHASSTPSDSMGLGIGYDFPWVNLFFARVWTKNDSSLGSPIGTTKSNVVGVSFDLSRGLDWLKPSK